MVTVVRLFLVLTLGLTLGLTKRLCAEEVQAHGLAFEHWLADTFFGGYRPTDYTGKWDIPAAANLDRGGGGIPVNPKAVRYGAPVGLGDALRQWDVDEPFLLVVAYWEQTTPTEKRFAKFVAARVEPAAWRELWGPVTRADLERLDALIKDRALSPEEARHQAQVLKTAPPFSEAVFAFNPKIDRYGQRRLQVSLRATDVFARLAPGLDPAPEAEPRLWGEIFPGPLASAPRRLKRK
jgi:hypothetical protein